MAVIHVETQFGPASLAVQASGADVLVTINLAVGPARRVTLTPEAAAHMAAQLRRASVDAATNLARATAATCRV